MDGEASVTGPPLLAQGARALANDEERIRSREVAEEAYRAMMGGEPMVVTGSMNKLRIASPRLASPRLAPRGMARKVAANLDKTA